MKEKTDIEKIIELLGKIEADLEKTTGETGGMSFHASRYLDRDPKAKWEWEISTRGEK